MRCFGGYGLEETKVLFGSQRVLVPAVVIEPQGDVVAEGVVAEQQL